MIDTTNGFGLEGINTMTVNELARSAALAWREAHEEHTYSELLQGLAAVLERQGYVYVSNGKGGWSDSLAGLLSNLFHWPLASYSLEMSVEEIVDGLCQAYSQSKRDGKRFGDWRGPSYHCSGKSIAEQCADFDQWAREVRARLEKQGIKRRGTRKWKEFYEQAKAPAWGAMRQQVELGRAELVKKAQEQAEQERSEWLPKIASTFGRWEQMEGILRMLCDAVGQAMPDELASWFDACREERARRTKMVDEHCTWIVQKIELDSVDDLIREGCRRRPELAPFAE